MTARRWRSGLVLLLTAFLAVGAAACGNGDDDDASASGSGSGAAESEGGASGAWPVEIEHLYGTTTIEERPERIVSLNVQWTDALLAMDVEPAAINVDQSSGDEDIFPWQEGLLDGVEQINLVDSIPLEQIAALEPDLILATYIVEDEQAYESLAAIAPTIGPLSDLEVDPWQDIVEVTAQFLGEPDAATTVIEEVDTVVAEAADAMPGLAGKTFLLVNYVPGDSLYVVADTEDGSSLFFQDLGLELLPALLDLNDGESGRVQLSFEQVTTLTSDLLVVLPNGGDLTDLPGWTNLPAVTSGGVSELSFAEVVGLNTPSPLSIPFALELIRPALESAAA